MFEISKNISINLEIFQDSKIYTIDNFYENPNSVLNFFLERNPDLWKKEQKPSYNGIYFEDRRHILFSEEIIKVNNFLSFLCGQSSKDITCISTNAIRFKKCNFNDYKNNYWWPHLDCGYTGIVYLNYGDEISGTNLYESLSEERQLYQYPEHFYPWINKDNYRLIKTLFPKFNRLVLFDASRFFHGMNICNDDYFFEDYRFNQVFFFQ